MTDIQNLTPSLLIQISDKLEQYGREDKEEEQKVRAETSNMLLNIFRNAVVGKFNGHPEKVQFLWPTFYIEFPNNHKGADFTDYAIAALNECLANAGNASRIDDTNEYGRCLRSIHDIKSGLSIF